jgi:hypothetical protein
VTRDDAMTSKIAPAPMQQVFDYHERLERMERQAERDRAAKS